MKVHIFLCLIFLILFGLSQANAQQKPTASPTAQNKPAEPAKAQDKTTGAGNGQKKVTEPYLPETVVIGQKLTIHGNFEDQGAWHLILTNVEHPETSVPAIADELATDKKSLTFILPNSLKEGRYFATVELDSGNGKQSFPVPGELRIPPPPAVKVTVDKVQPIPDPYPNAKNPKAKDGKSYDFVTAGTNFARELKNNHVEINGIPIPDLKYADSKYQCVNGYPCLNTESGSETRKLIVEGYSPESFSHPMEVAVRVGDGDNVAKAADPLIVSSISKTRLHIYAVGAFLALVGILFALVQAGIKLRRADDATFNSLRAFLIDKETNSYSLSKFQLTLFTLVTVFGYIYVFVCHLFVQWKFELPPVPEGLPSMMAVSVGTSVVAAGIGTRIGGKGAGAESPSLADFITSGGVVLPERFQFFLWTIVSSMGVLVLILASDPVTVTQLPKLPDGMLYLMGLSSAGYLGGKLVRGPGPSIKSIDAAKVAVPAKPAAGGKPAVPAHTALELTITGDNLSPDATFQLDDEKIPADQASIVDQNDDPQHKQFCSMLKVQLRDVAERYFEKPHVLRIVNPDSQGAEITYGTTVDPIPTITAGHAPVKVTVKGSNFKDPSTASWINAAGAATPIAKENITKKSDTELEITLTPGDAGNYKLAIISPGGLTTTVDVQVA